MKSFFNINIPVFFKVSILGYKDVFKIINIQDDSKKFKILVAKNSNYFFFDKWSNSIVFFDKNVNSNITKVENSFSAFFKSVNLYFYSKIKFKGKGFRIKFLKKSKIIKFFFGRSHITFIVIKNICKKRINKYKFILKSINKKSLNKLSKKITNIKKFNVYTLRGIRKSKQIIFKRKGKKGTYI